MNVNPDKPAKEALKWILKNENVFSFWGTRAADSCAYPRYTLVLLAFCPGYYPESYQLPVLCLAPWADDNADGLSVPFPSQRWREGLAVCGLRRTANLCPVFRDVQSVSNSSLDSRQRLGSLFACD